MAATIIDELKNCKLDGKSLYDHLQKTAVQMALDQHSLDHFEEYSFSAKTQKKTDVVFRVREAYAHLRDYQIKHRALVSKINAGSEEQPQDVASLGHVPDLNDEARYFEKFGVGFGEDETYKIFKALCRFTHKKNAKQIKFWGKILGSEKDYYVIEGNADGGNEQAGELTPDTEPKGTGANKYSFWVSNELGSGNWTELPPITPAQLKLSRRVKRIFSGDLNRAVVTNPQFPGKQAHLLKCQLVRINFACSIVPKGMFVPNAEDPKEVDAPEDFVFPDFQTLAAKENWVYLNPTILQNGRISLMKPEGLEPQEEEKFMKAQAARDPVEPRLKPIALSSELWSLRTASDNDLSWTLARDSKMIKRGVVGLKSLQWMGWVTVAWNGRFSSVYVGTGHKAGHNYYPSEPENILQHNSDRSQFILEE